MAWLSLRREANASPSAEPGASGEVDPGFAEALAEIVRTFGRYGFPLSPEDIGLERRCEAWSRHLLQGEAPPLDRAEPPSGPRRFALGDLRLFFNQRRRAEQGFVTTAVGELRGALVDTLSSLERTFAETAGGDQAITADLRALAEEAKGSDPTVLRARVIQTVSAVAKRFEERQQRHEQRLATLASAVHLLRDDLLQERERASKDPLTGLANRRVFDAELARLVVVSRVTREPLTLILIDVDHFKRVNDQHGHPAGDAVLKGLADVLIRAFPRKRDVVARFGGEEMAVILPDCGAVDARRLAERFLADLRSRRFTIPAGELGVTCSAGLAVVRPGEAPEELVARADASLYEAKGAGRDRLVAAEP